MLGRSHRRLDERLIELRRAVEAIVRERATADDLEVVDSVLDYLERSALRHELDEEESLFPRLRGHRDLIPLLHDLHIEHEEHRRLVANLRSLRNGWAPSGPDASAGAAMVIAVTDLSRAYRSHIQREDRELLPAARVLLAPADVAALSGEMDARRGRGGDGGGGGNGAGRGNGRNGARRPAARRRPGERAGRRREL